MGDGTGAGVGDGTGAARGAPASRRRVGGGAHGVKRSAPPREDSGGVRGGGRQAGHCLARAHGSLASTSPPVRAPLHAGRQAPPSSPVSSASTPPSLTCSSRGLTCSTGSAPAALAAPRGGGLRSPPPPRWGLSAAARALPPLGLAGEPSRCLPRSRPASRSGPLRRPYGLKYELYSSVRAGWDGCDAGWARHMRRQGWQQRHPPASCCMGTKLNPPPPSTPRR